ncbi:hypothetical protein CYLTODRAFT_426320 [Cylindrobasidium torrendii FP15055 ss-10]|uniref:Uncharacterized protein n=1 Tax=Cylindrobasidium torrendii FP15055 ss-10 TaxID=1314674 RepID=A0A0D7B104_9AGAR|nr:hypothetical protein CYLTODRAFT_426320 [Cylindrobasidium torrendii FP15055 ss-10]
MRRRKLVDAIKEKLGESARASFLSELEVALLAEFHRAWRASRRAREGRPAHRLLQTAAFLGKIISLGYIGNKAINGCVYVMYEELYTLAHLQALHILLEWGLTHHLETKQSIRLQRLLTNLELMPEMFDLVHVGVGPADYAALKKMAWAICDT